VPLHGLREHRGRGAGGGAGDACPDSPCSHTWVRSHRM